MNQKAFANNYSDHSDSNGFQFEFYCERCHDAFRTPYKRHAASTASNILGTASNIFGGLFGSAGTVVDHMRDSGYRNARDEAFAEACESAEGHFNRCLRCANYYCDKCYNPNLSLCTYCAPSVEEEANVAAREMEIDMARNRAATEVQQGRKTDENVVCPHCQARVKSGKFCAECGGKLEAKKFCVECGTEMQPGARFCADCGTRNE